MKNRFEPKSALLYLIISLFIIILSGCTQLLKQQTTIPFEPPATLNYKKYFTSHKATLNPIEGIWTEYVVGTLYDNGTVVKREEIPKRASWIIIKNKNEYQILNEYGEQNKYIASFKPAREKDTYIFNAYYLKSKDRVKAEAKLVDGHRIEMAYEAPQGMFDQNYIEIENLNHSDKQLTLLWQFNWLKIFPNPN